MLSVVISVYLPVSVSAQGFLFLQVTDHIPLHLLQSLLQQVFSAVTRELNRLSDGLKWVITPYE
ncbi:hypothetical protein AXK30_18925 [Escherichia coli]|nr:hypothetical protein AXK30_18925 [Escherichia coli]